MIYDTEVPVAQSRYVTVDGTDVRYLQAGDTGSPVVLVHGSGIDDAALSWRRTIPALADQYRVYAPDLPGYGQSDPPGAQPTVPYYRDVLERTLEAIGLGAEPVTLVGISMGGAVALGTAVANPNRWQQLVLVDSYGLVDRVPGGTGAYLLANVPFVDTIGRQFATGTQGAARAAIGQFVHDTDELSATFLDAVGERLTRPNAGRAFVQFQRAEFNADGVETSYEDQLHELTGPVTFFHGREDPLIPVTWAETAASSIDGATLRVLEECGHWPPRERPEQFNELLLASLRENHQSN